MATEMLVEKSILIDKPVQEVFSFLIITRNQEQFSVWNMKDPSKITHATGTDGTVGFVYSWDSKMKDVGAGSQEITKIVEGQEIEYALRFERPMKNTGVSRFIVEPAGENQTRVIWEFRGPMKFPMSLFKGMIQKMLGKDIAQSLENLKGKLV
jgi:uncharacterized protein YndB with AHSA1/START domain